MKVSRRPLATWFAFAALAAVALVAIWFVFELRYMWYVDAERFRFLRLGFISGVGLIVLLWAFYPSRILVGLVAIAIFVFPPALRSDQFVSLDLASFPWIVGVALLLVGATELRRRARPIP